jgi:LPPG:FO 2-phospho-L-lactate transferase
MASGRWWSFQEFMIRAGRKDPVEDVDFRGAANARPSPEALEAIATAQAIVIGPSNPVISIGPILAVPGIRPALDDSPAAVVAVSPLVAGAVVKGPTAAFMAWAGRPLSSDGIAAHYEGVIDGLVADARAQDVPMLETDVLMDSPAARRRVAEETLRFALALR